jgi:hypothetical protein
MIVEREKCSMFHRPRPKLKADREARARLHRDILNRADELEAEGEARTAEHLRYTVNWLRSQTDQINEREV